jgi:hypothetical protein
MSRTQSIDFWNENFTAKTVRYPEQRGNSTRLSIECTQTEERVELGEADKAP